MDLSILLLSLYLSQGKASLLYTQSAYGDCENGCGDNSPIIGNELYLGKQITKLRKRSDSSTPCREIDFSKNWPPEFDDESGQENSHDISLIGAALDGKRAVIGIEGHELIAWTTNDCGVTWKEHRGEQLLGEQKNQPLLLYLKDERGKRYKIELVSFLKDKHQFWLQNVRSWNSDSNLDFHTYEFVSIPNAPSYQFQLTTQHINSKKNVCPWPYLPDERLRVRSVFKPDGDLNRPYLTNAPVIDGDSVFTLSKTKFHAVLFTGDRYNKKEKEVNFNVGCKNSDPTKCALPGPNSNSPDPRGKKTLRWMNIACNNTASQKMHLAGHTIAASNHISRTLGANREFELSKNEKQALLNAITAKYCPNISEGLSKPLTVPGQRLEYTHLRGEFDIPKVPGRFEAIWNERGAICISTPRRSEALGEYESRKRIREACPGLRDCSSLSPLQWELALGIRKPTIAPSDSFSTYTNTLITDTNNTLSDHLVATPIDQLLQHDIRIKVSPNILNDFFPDHPFLQTRISRDSNNQRTIHNMECSMLPLETRTNRCSGPPWPRRSPIAELHETPSSWRDVKRATIITYLPTTCRVIRDDGETVNKREDPRRIEFLGCACRIKCNDNDRMTCCPDSENW